MSTRPTFSLLLRCGALAGPLFIVTVLVQDVTRPGFDPRIHLLSQLSLGPLGWIQVANFTLTGALSLLYAAGLWTMDGRGRSGALAAALLGVFGAFLVVVGVCRTDPANGFPPGVPQPPQPSIPGIIHALGALFIFLGLAGAIAAFSIFFRGRRQRGMAAYCLISAMLLLGVFVYAMSHPTITGPALQLAVVIGWTAPSVVALWLLRHDAALP